MPTIALVDDDRNILTSLRMLLEAEGYKILAYTDGVSAYDGIMSDPPDLAILDIKMPRMDGMELLRRLRQKSEMPVIFLTSKDDEIDELFGLKMGADDFIRKPFTRGWSLSASARSCGEASRARHPRRQEDAAKIIERGKLKLDPERHTCIWDGKQVTLTVTEFLILQALGGAAGRRQEPRRAHGCRL